MNRSVHLTRSLAAALLGTALLSPLSQAQTVPGPEHHQLQKLEGTWTGAVKTDGGDSTATVTYKSACGGLWLLSDFQGEFGGQPFQGHGVDGYDTAKGKYVSVWVDSVNTRPMVFEGNLDAAKTTLTTAGEGTGFDGQPAKFKSVTKFVDDDHMTVTMFIIGSDGVENRMMTIEYARKK